MYFPETTDYYVICYIKFLLFCSLGENGIVYVYSNLPRTDFLACVLKCEFLLCSEIIFTILKAKYLGFIHPLDEITVSCVLPTHL